MASLELADYGWDHFFHRQLPDELPPTIVPVRVMNVQKSGMQISSPNIETHLDASMVGEDCAATVGDWLLFDCESGRAVQRLERKSLFQRRAPGTDRRVQLIAANVDTLFVVSSCNQDFNEAHAFPAYRATTRLQAAERAIVRSSYAGPCRRLTGCPESRFDRVRGGCS